MRHLALALIALTLLLLGIAATADGNPANPPAPLPICEEAAPDSGATVPTIERVSWSELKAGAKAAPIQEAYDD